MFFTVKEFCEAFNGKYNSVVHCNHYRIIFTADYISCFESWHASCDSSEMQMTRTLSVLVILAIVQLTNCFEVIDPPTTDTLNMGISSPISMT
jgi:hypothetical protein